MDLLDRITLDALGQCNVPGQIIDIYDSNGTPKWRPIDQRRSTKYIRRVTNEKGKKVVRDNEGKLVKLDFLIETKEDTKEATATVKEAAQTKSPATKNL